MADVGVCLGVGNTRMAQAAADIVAGDCEFVRLVDTVKWGTYVYDVA